MAPSNAFGGPLRWAVVGAGGVALSHLESLADHPAAELVGVVDPDVERAASVATEFGVVARPDLDSLLEVREVDAATVAVPNHLHVAVCDDLLSRGIAPLVEKPLAPDLASAEHILRSARAVGLPVGAILNMRYLAPMRALAEACQEGWVRPREIEMCGELARRSPGTWRTDPAYAGSGLLLEVGVHYLDLLVWWLGTPDRVEVAEGGLRPDHVDVTLGWPATTAHLVLRATAESGRPVEVLVESDEGRARVVAGEVTCPTIPDLEARTSAIARSLPRPSTALLFGPGHLGAIRSAAAHLRRHDRFPVDGRQAMAAIELCDRLARAA